LNSTHNRTRQWFDTWT